MWCVARCVCRSKYTSSPVPRSQFNTLTTQREVVMIDNANIHFEMLSGILVDVGQPVHYRCNQRNDTMSAGSVCCTAFNSFAAI
jgi:hypothetical protein